MGVLLKIPERGGLPGEGGGGQGCARGIWGGGAPSPIYRENEPPFRRKRLEITLFRSKFGQNRIRIRSGQTGPERVWFNGRVDRSSWGGGACSSSGKSLLFRRFTAVAALYQRTAKGASGKGATSKKRQKSTKNVKRIFDTSRHFFAQGKKRQKVPTNNLRNFLTIFAQRPFSSPLLGGSDCSCGSWVV